MTDIQPDQIAPDSAAAATVSVGTILREARLNQGLSIDDVSGRIKFAPRQIEALEADDFTHVPENAFLRGFVRSYAHLLQIDPAPLLDALPHKQEAVATPEAKAAAETPYPGIYTERKSNIIWLAAACVVAIALGLFVWLLGGKHEERQAEASGAQNTRVQALVLPAAVPVSAVPEAEPALPVRVEAAKKAPDIQKPEAQKSPAPALTVTTPPKAVVPVVPPAPAAVATPPKVSDNKSVLATPASPPVAQPVKQKPEAVQPGQESIRMVFEGDSWTEIKDKDGQVLMGQLNHTGDELTVKGSPPFTLTFGYASGVKLYYKGKQIDLASYARLEVAHLTLE